MKVNITIPTYNRAHCLPNAIKAALDQSYPDLTVTVVDDGSTDGTSELVERYRDNHRFNYIKLGDNRGTATAKNVSILVSDYDAITFHDSDDIPHRDKILLQVRSLEVKGTASPMMDWEPFGIEPDSELAVEVSLTGHEVIKTDGSTHSIDKRISLVDDFFPNLQYPSKTEGDWVLINSGLFRRSVFERFGGYLDSVEEDRELRNRLIAGGVVVNFVPRPLLTKIEMAESLTLDSDTGYRGAKREADRNEVRRRTARYREGLWGKRVVPEMVCRISVDPGIASVSNPAMIRLNVEIPMSDAVRKSLAMALGAEPSARIASGESRPEITRAAS